MELFIDLSTSIAFEREPPEPDLMSRPPRHAERPLLTNEILARIGGRGRRSRPSRPSSSCSPTAGRSSTRPGSPTRRSSSGRSSGPTPTEASASRSIASGATGSCSAPVWSRSPSRSLIPYVPAACRRLPGHAARPRRLAARRDHCSRSGRRGGDHPGPGPRPGRLGRMRQRPHPVTLTRLPVLSLAASHDRAPGSVP